MDISLLYFQVKADIISGSNEKDPEKRRQKAAQLLAFVRENTSSEKEAQWLLETAFNGIDFTFGKRN